MSESKTPPLWLLSISDGGEVDMREIGELINALVQRVAQLERELDARRSEAFGGPIDTFGAGYIAPVST